MVFSRQDHWKINFRAWIWNLAWIKVLTTLTCSETSKSYSWSFPKKRILNIFLGVAYFSGTSGASLLHGRFSKKIGKSQSKLVWSRLLSMPSFKSRFESWFYSGPDGSHGFCGKMRQSLCISGTEDNRAKPFQVFSFITQIRLTNRISLDPEAFQQLEVPSTVKHGRRTL